MLHGRIERAGFDRTRGARLGLGGAGHHHQGGRTGFVRSDIGRRFHIHGAGGGSRCRYCRSRLLQRRGRGTGEPMRTQLGLHLVGAVEEPGDGILLGLKRVGGGLEPVLRRNQRAVQFVIGHLQIGDAVLISRLHLLVAMVLGGDDAVLEDHIDGGKRHPAQENQGEAGKGRLQRRPEGEKLHSTVAANIDLALGEGGVQPCPGAFQERRLGFGILLVSFALNPSRHHPVFRPVPEPRPALVPEKRARGQSRGPGAAKAVFIGTSPLPERLRHGRAL